MAEVTDDVTDDMSDDMSDVSDGTDAQPVSLGRAWAVYTGLRFVVFLGTAIALYLVLGLNGLPLLLVAVLVSSIASLFFLRSQRERLVAAQERRVATRQQEKAQLRGRLDREPE